VTEEISPGFFVNTGALELEGMVSSGIAADLHLEKHGLRWLRSSHLLASWVGRDVLYLSRSLPETLREINSMLGKDAARQWEDFVDVSTALMSGLGGVQHVSSAYAPISSDCAEHPFRRLADRDLRIALSSAEAVVREHLSHSLLQAAAIAYSTHPQMPPWAPGSGALGCLLASSHGAHSCRPLGGSGQLIEALLGALRQHGGSLQCGAGAKRIVIEEGRVAGVELDSGQLLCGEVAVASIGLPRVAAMIEPGLAPTLHSASAHAHSGAYNVGEMKLDIALDATPEVLNARPDFAAALYYLQHHPDNYSQAMKSILAGRLPDQLPMMAAVPSLADPTLAPPGKAVLWLSAFVPARWADGSTWPEANARVAEAMLDSWEQFAPGTRGLILAMQSTGPHEWEQRTGNPAGNPNHLDMTPDQLFTFRPAPGLGGHRTPIRGLYLSGAGTHPGGGVHGMPGLQAANAIFADHALKSP
jgi:phytoene dehydrogenase-like protein